MNLALKNNKTDMQDNSSVSELVIKEITLWIDRNTNKVLSVKDIAKRSGYSKRHIQRLFKKHTGIGVACYIREVKLNKIANELCNSNETISDIIFRYGYDSQQTLTRIFSKKFKMSPGVYRKYQGGI